MQKLPSFFSRCISDCTIRQGKWDIGLARLLILTSGWTCKAVVTPADGAI